MSEITLGGILGALASMVEGEAAKKQWDKLDVQIEHAGRAITLPAEPGKMPLEKALEALQRRIKDESQPFTVHEVIDAFPHDGAVAFVGAMKNLYGWASPQTVMTFFGPRPPQMLSIKTGPGSDDVVQCPFGAFKLPGIEEDVHTRFGHDSKGRPNFEIISQVKKRDRHVLLELAAETRRLVKEASIYRGKAIRLGVDEDGSLNMDQPPEYLDVSDTTESNLLFDDHVQDQINTNLLVPIKHTALCKKIGIPLKRGVLLEGPFGTGKSLTARMVANTCEQNGWTFVLLDKVQGLKTALQFATRYAPAVVFAEDIDRVATERDEDMNDLINTIDGVVSKGTQIMTVLTTNFVGDLNPVILRPGRLDAVISLRAPNAETAVKLIRHYAGSLVDVDEDLTQAGEELAGQIPASIRECVERAKLGMIGRGAHTLSNQDLVVSGQTMKNHLALLNKDKVAPSASDRLAAALREVLGGGSTVAAGTDLTGLSTQIGEHYRLSDRIEDRVMDVKGMLERMPRGASANGAGDMSEVTDLLKRLDKRTQLIAKTVRPE